MSLKLMQMIMELLPLILFAFYFTSCCNLNLFPRFVMSQYNSLNVQSLPNFEVETPS